MNINFLPLIKFPPPPSVSELAMRYSLTGSEYRRVFDGHDIGDEEPRRYIRFVCRIGHTTLSGRVVPRCHLDPGHLGSHHGEP